MAAIDPKQTFVGASARPLEIAGSESELSKSLRNYGHLTDSYSLDGTMRSIPVSRGDVRPHLHGWLRSFAPSPLAKRKICVPRWTQAFPRSSIPPRCGRDRGSEPAMSNFWQHQASTGRASERGAS